MLTVVYALIILSPVVFVVLLPLMRAPRWRRWAYLSMLFASFLSLLVIALFGWLIPALVEKDLPPTMRVRSLFDEPLRTFFGSGWLMAGYMIAVALAGRWAVRAAGGAASLTGGGRGPYRAESAPRRTQFR